MTRDNGIKLIQEYSFKKPQNLDKFIEWLGITENGFNYLIDQHRNPLYWKRNGEWEWEFISHISNSEMIDFDKVRLGLIENESDFILTESKISSDVKDKYILIGKGK
jgi:hypothetical protein